MNLPNLAGVATADLVEKIGTGKFSASYINWSRTMHLLRTEAPGWLPELVTNTSGGILHSAPVGAYLLIRFRNGDTVTPEVPQAVMDHTNKAIAFDKITARDVTDTHRRGVCLAAAITFGLAYELWAKMPLESGYHKDDSEPASEPAPKHSAVKNDPAVENATPEEREALSDIAMEAMGLVKDGKPTSARDFVKSQNLDNDQKTLLWSLLDAPTRSALKTAEKAPQIETA